MVRTTSLTYCVIQNTVLDTRWVFDHSMKTNINRADILVRMLAIDAFYKKNDFGFDFYNAMQRTRCSLNDKVSADYADHLDCFIELIQSMKKGYDYTKPILLNSNRELLDGSHRLSLCMYYNIEKIPVIICDNQTSIDYSLQWFLDNGLQHFEKYILQKYKEIIHK